MERKSISLALVLFLLLGHAPLVLSQQPTDNWAAVQQLRVSEDLVVKRKDGKQIKGEMIEASENTLTIDRDGKPLGIPRADVRQVYVIEGKAQKGKWAWIGAGVGAGAGAGIGAAKHSSTIDDGEIYVVFGTLLGTGIGAVSGMLLGQSRRKRVLVYEAR